MNNCVIYGRLGQDAEYSTLQSGTGLLKFSLANNTGYGDKKKTNWFRCAMFGERGSKIVEFLKKGTAVIVSGEVTLNTWQGNDGGEHTELSLNVREVSFAGNKADGAASGGGQASQKQQSSKPAQQPLGGPMSFDDDDIPF